MKDWHFGVIALTVTGMLLATVVYVFTQGVGSDDPFAIELIFWWSYADIFFLSGLKGWTLCFSSEVVRNNGPLIASVLAMTGMIIGVVALAFSIRTWNHYGQPQGYVIWAGPENRWFLPRISRRFLPRGLASGFSAVHLAIFFV